MRAIILAGGKGTRLQPYTTVLPKPLMPIGDMPILEVVLRQLKAARIDRITMAVGYLAELLRAFFDDGMRIGMPIDYSIEPKPLGTVGPLTLIPDLSATFLMMNGDVLTTLNYADLIAYHRRSGAIATIATHMRQVKIDFGVIEADKSNRLTQYVEKPTDDYQVSMGVYVFEPEVLGYLNPGEYRDFPDLVQTLIADGKKVMSYPFSGYWLDIGRTDDYARAIEEFESRRAEFLPDEYAHAIEEGESRQADSLPVETR
jgi:NDP-mannose synthase